MAPPQAACHCVALPAQLPELPHRVRRGLDEGQVRIGAGCRTGVGGQRHALEGAAQRLAVGLGDIEMHRHAPLVWSHHVHRRAVGVGVSIHGPMPCLDLAFRLLRRAPGRAADRPAAAEPTSGSIPHRVGGEQSRQLRSARSRERSSCHTTRACWTGLGAGRRVSSAWTSASSASRRSRDVGAREAESSHRTRR